MKKKVLIIVIILLLVFCLCMLVPNIKTNSKQFDELLNRISQTNSVIIYGGVSYSEEYITYLDNEYKEFKILEDEKDVKKIVKELSNIELYNGPIITPMPKYIIHLLDENGNLLEEFTMHPFTTSSISVRLKNGDEKLYEIIEEDKISYDCLSDLDTYLSTENNSLNMVDILGDITNRNIVRFSQIVTTDNGWIYALINTEDSEAIKDFDKYFNNNYQGYIKQKLIDNFVLYLYNEQKELDLKELSNCIK